jgi:hypothetical protein
MWGRGVRIFGNPDSREGEINDVGNMQTSSVQTEV